MSSTLGPFVVHVYGLLLRARGGRGGRDHAPPLGRLRGGSRRAGLRRRALGGSRPASLGGRLYFLATTPGDAFEHWWGPLAVWEGGLGIWGGIAARHDRRPVARKARRRRASPNFLDAAAPALLVAQAIGRVGNYFNQELFGRPTDVPWALEIDRDHRPDRYLADPTFHPTFLYELLWNLALAAALVWLVQPPHASARLVCCALYVRHLCAFRIVDELLRVDAAAHVFGLRWNLVLAIAGTAIGVAWFAANAAPHGRRDAAPPLPRNDRRA